MRIVCLLKWFYGVTVAQEILVLLETVRVSLELLQFFFIYVLLLMKVVVQKMLNLHLFGACFYLVLTFISQLLATSR